MDLPSRFDVSALKRINLTVLSLLPVAINWPSGVHARQYIEPLWCFVLLKRTVGWYVWWSSLETKSSSLLRVLPPIFPRFFCIRLCLDRAIVTNACPFHFTAQVSPAKQVNKSRESFHSCSSIQLSISTQENSRRRSSRYRSLNCDSIKKFLSKKRRRKRTRAFKLFCRQFLGENFLFHPSYIVYSPRAVKWKKKFDRQRSNSKQFSPSLVLMRHFPSTSFPFFVPTRLRVVLN